MNIFMYKLYIIHMGSSKTADTWNITSSFLRPTAPVTRQSKETYCNTLGVLWGVVTSVPGAGRGATARCVALLRLHTSSAHLRHQPHLTPPSSGSGDQPTARSAFYTVFSKWVGINDINVRRGEIFSLAIPLTRESRPQMSNWCNTFSHHCT